MKNFLLLFTMVLFAFVAYSQKMEPATGSGTFIGNGFETFDETAQRISVDNAELILAPNPVSDILRISVVLNAKVLGPDELSDVYIRGMTGKVVMSLKNLDTYEIDISSLNSGTYLIQGRIMGQTVQKKFITP